MPRVTDPLNLLHQWLGNLENLGQRVSLCNSLCVIMVCLEFRFSQLCMILGLCNEFSGINHKLTAFRQAPGLHLISRIEVMRARWQGKENLLLITKSLKSVFHSGSAKKSRKYCLCSCFIPFSKLCLRGLNKIHASKSLCVIMQNLKSLSNMICSGITHDLSEF